MDSKSMGVTGGVGHQAGAGCCLIRKIPFHHHKCHRPRAACEALKKTGTD